MTARGKFITIEGIEGVGKSTNLDFVQSVLEDRGREVVRTREPGGTPSAERIRQVLLELGDESIPDIAELLLFFAARSLNLENLIRPALATGQWVLCDRFTDATRAYQGAGRGLDRERIDTLAGWVHDGLEPDLTLLLDAPVEVGFARIAARRSVDRMESEARAFYERVRAGYLDLAAANPDRFAVIDAAQSLADVQNDIRAALRKLELT